MNGTLRTLFAIGSFVFGSVAVSRAQAISESHETYGVSDTAYVVGAYDFDVSISTTTYSSDTATGDRFFTSPGSVWVASVFLPNGAVVTRIEIQGCDTSATGALSAFFISSTTAGGTQTQTLHGAVFSGPPSDTPGCAFFSNVITPATVANQARAYQVVVNQGTLNSTNRFAAVRLFYHLQVSPAPATATFPNDVPTTHPFFRFIEALAASGITGGCGGGAYCPDAAVTRGQMAVFLATALGLHFPN